MNKKTKIVLNGYLELNSEEKSEFIKALNEFNKKEFSDRRRYKENIGGVVLGPLDTGCPCCGR